MTYDNIYKNQRYPRDMTGHLLNIRVHEELYQDALELSKKEGYSSLQDFARNAIREKVKTLKTEMILMQLNKIRGSAKGTAKLASREELSQLAKKLFK